MTQQANHYTPVVGHDYTIEPNTLEEIVYWADTLSLVPDNEVQLINRLNFRLHLHDHERYDVTQAFNNGVKRETVRKTVNGKTKINGLLTETTNLIRRCTNLQHLVIDGYVGQDHGQINLNIKGILQSIPIKSNLSQNTKYVKHLEVNLISPPRVKREGQPSDPSHPFPAPAGPLREQSGGRGHLCESLPVLLPQLETLKLGLPSICGAILQLPQRMQRRGPLKVELKTLELLVNRLHVSEDGPAISLWSSKPCTENADLKDSLRLAVQEFMRNENVSVQTANILEYKEKHYNMTNEQESLGTDSDETEGPDVDHEDPDDFAVRSNSVRESDAESDGGDESALECNDTEGQNAESSGTEGVDAEVSAAENCRTDKREAESCKGEGPSTQYSTGEDGPHAYSGKLGTSNDDSEPLEDFYSNFDSDSFDTSNIDLSLPELPFKLPDFPDDSDSETSVGGGHKVEQSNHLTEDRKNGGDGDDGVSVDDTAGQLSEPSQDRNESVMGSNVVDQDDLKDQGNEEDQGVQGEPGHQDDQGDQAEEGDEGDEDDEEITLIDDDKESIVFHDWTFNKELQEAAIVCEAYDCITEAVEETLVW